MGRAQVLVRGRMFPTLLSALNNNIYINANAKKALEFIYSHILYFCFLPGIRCLVLYFCSMTCSAEVVILFCGRPVPLL